MKNLKVALLQLLPEDALDKNLRKGMEYCRIAKDAGADIALFPEMWSVGYEIPEDLNKLKASAIAIDSPFINSFRELAKELQMAIGITFLEQYEPLPRNTLCMIDRFGNIVLIYAKVHTCDFGDECRLTAGDDFLVVNLNTVQGYVKVGVMICYDREFPESARILMLKGAEIILVPNACPIEINRFSQLRTRAYENMVGIATANYPKNRLDCNGRSCAFDGIAYHPSGMGSRDMLISEAGEHEEVCIVNFPIEKLREYRADEVHGNAYRHPQKYKLLIEESIEEPFVRSDYRK
ncbi:carbon-nitrogen hydrolase family protein [Parabacteroides faecis]|uniref:Amidohydrolase n=1 Tax=Parabacteroides faecis TaxID=1217282 RepID=A0ABR6KWD2_9BACT|nr:carbon-nitrogen hydrolase family protein [Parabacteroides faecis]MBB4625197.1 putative amidohydrolase [Parabacteroides faecis]GGK19467.1 carbon-nitrogen hydrolase [Parabacteroides faecis]